MSLKVSRRELEVLELFAEAQGEHRDKVVRLEQKGYTQTICDDRAKRRWREANTDKQRVYSKRSYYKNYDGPPVMCVLCRRGFVTKESLTTHWWAKHREQQTALADARTVEQLRRQLERVTKQLAPLETERERLLDAIRQFGG